MKKCFSKRKQSEVEEIKEAEKLRYKREIEGDYIQLDKKLGRIRKIEAEERKNTTKRKKERKGRKLRS